MPDARMQLRLLLEQKCREVAELIAKWAPPGVGFTLFLFDFGEDGNVAYVSTARRRDMLRLVEEWLAREKAKTS